MRIDNLNASFSGDILRITRGKLDGLSVGDSIIIENAGKNSVLGKKRAFLAEDDDIVTAMILDKTDADLKLFLINKNGQTARFRKCHVNYITIMKVPL